MIRMVGYGFGAIISASGLVGLTELDPVTTGQKLAETGSAAFLGIALCVCVAAIVRMYVAQEKNHKEHSEILMKLISASTGAIQANTDATQKNSDLCVEVKDQLVETRQAIEICKELRAPGKK